MPLFMDSNFPPGLLNPGSGATSSSTEDAASWCVQALGVSCPTRRELLWNVFFTSHGVWLLIPLSIIVLLVYRLLGPPEVDEREEQLRRQWEEHKQRFRSGAKRSSLRGVIKSSYLTELSGNEGAEGQEDQQQQQQQPKRLEQQRSKEQEQEELQRDVTIEESSTALAVETSARGRGKRTGSGSGSGSSRSSDDGWEDVLAADTGSRRVAAAGTDPSTPRPPTPRETVQLLTTPGPTRVTIVGRNASVETPAGIGSGKGEGGVSGGGGKKGRRLVVLTVHAAGHNHRTCFGALERELYRDELGGEGGDVVFYHVDIPGHEEEQKDDVEATELSLEALAAQLLQVTIQLGLEWFVGLGVGAGANVLLRYACDNPDKIAGLILANPSADQAGSRERNAWLNARFRLSWGKDMKASRESLVPMSFSPNSSLASRYRAALGTMHAGNLLKYIDAALARDDIPASRLQALNDTWVLVLCGTGGASGGAGIGNYLSSFVAGVNSVAAATSLMDKLQRATAAATGTAAEGSGGVGGGSKATLVKLSMGGGGGGGLLEAKPLDTLAVMKLFLNKCF